MTDCNNRPIEVKGKAFRGDIAFTLLGKSIEVGDIAPDFTVTDNNLGEVHLSDFKGKTVILSIFPSIDTEVCATQTRAFNKRATSLSDDVVILTLSKDLPFALKRFCAAEGIKNVHTLSDYKSNDFGLKYGFLIKELQLLWRGVVIIDKSGRVIYVEYVHEMTHEPDYDKALAALK